MSNEPALNIKTGDGRFARSKKTKDAIVRALLKLLRNTPFPTAEQVAKESKIGLRTVYRQFKDMESIYLSLHEECMHSLGQIFNSDVDLDRPFNERVSFAIRERFTIYEKYETLFIATISNSARLPTLVNQVAESYQFMRERFIKIVPEIENLSTIKSDLLFTRILFPSWFSLRNVLRHDQKIIIDELSNDLMKYIKSNI